MAEMDMGESKDAKMAMGEMAVSAPCKSHRNRETGKQRKHTRHRDTKTDKQTCQFGERLSVRGSACTWN